MIMGEAQDIFTLITMKKSFWAIFGEVLWEKSPKKIIDS